MIMKDINAEVNNAMQSLGIIGRNPKLLQAIYSAIKAAPYDVNVLVQGENGSGKEVFHKILHSYSNRKHGKCIPVNCGALPEGTINSELFGHVKGSFTGATSDRKGFFEEANKGTIFLDEVGELPLDTQARLLRVLQSGEFQRMGSNEILKTDVRVVAATNKNLLEAIQRGTFREDLYYRLAGITINVPALRERPEDIDLLFRKFAGNWAATYGCPPIVADAAVQQKLNSYNWPGNVRQLQSLVETLSILSPERTITLDMLNQVMPAFEAGVAFGNSQHHDEFDPGEKKFLYNMIFNLKTEIEEIRAKLGMSTNAPISHPTHTLPPAPQEMLEEQEIEEVATEFVPAEQGPIITPPPTETNRPATLEEIERKAILEALERNGGNKRKAADELQIAERTIHRKIESYNIQ